MKIFYSPVTRQTNAIKVVVDESGFSVEHAAISTDEKTGEIIGVADFEYGPELVVKYDDIRARKDFADHSVFNLYDRSAYGSNPVELFNFFEATKQYKETGYEYALRTNKNSTASLIIPFASAPTSEWVLGFHVRGPEYFTIVGADALEHPVDTVGGLGSLREMMLPDVVFSSESVVVQSGTVAELDFSVLTPNGQPYTGESEVYFEATGGVLLLSRVKSTGGNGKVFLSVPSELPSGTSFKVKAGFKNYSGKAECKITVA